MMVPQVMTDPRTGQNVLVTSMDSERSKIEVEIKAACNEYQTDADWTKNMDICDKLNRNPYLCAFAIKSIRAQLKTKNPEIEILALTLTEAIVKNCPHAHAAVSQNDFMRYLVKVALNQRHSKTGVLKSFSKRFIRKEVHVNESHLRSQVIDKALMLLQMLALAYEHNNTFPIFQDTYRALRQQGVRFPAPTTDESMQIFTPNPVVPSNPPPSMHYPNAMGSVYNSNVAPIGSAYIPQVSNYTVDRTMEMIRPVFANTDVTDPQLNNAQENAVLLFEMMNASNLGSNLMTNDLVQELVRAVKVHQSAIVLSIQDPNAPPDRMVQALCVNDILNQALEDYDALSANRKRRYEEGIDIASMINAENENDSEHDEDLDEVVEAKLQHEEPVIILPPPSEQPNHNRKASRAVKAQANNEPDDLLGFGGADMVGNQPPVSVQPVINNNENNNNSNNVPFDPMGGLFGGPSPVEQPIVSSLVSQTKQGEPSVPTSDGEDDPFAGLRDENDLFGPTPQGNPPSGAADFLSSVNQQQPQTLIHEPEQPVYQTQPQFQPVVMQQPQPMFQQPMYQSQPMSQPQPQMQPMFQQPNPMGANMYEQQHSQPQQYSAAPLQPQVQQVQPQAQPQGKPVNPFDLLGGDPFAAMGVPDATPNNTNNNNNASATDSFVSNPFDVLGSNNLNSQQQNGDKNTSNSQNDDFLSGRDPFASFM